jgi:GntR family transcriptional regulator
VIAIDPRASGPLYQQIAGVVRDRIGAGVFVPGQRLPTVRELGVALGLNFNTVARAYRVLEAEGWITSRQGRGTFVEGAPAEGIDPARPALEGLTRAFLRAADQAGYSPHEVQWEFSGALRAWLQFGEPPE